MPLRVTVSDGRGRSARAPGLAAWLRRVAPARATGAVTVALVTDARMRQLNRTFGGKDYATDVLTFPSDARLVPRAVQAASQRFLGDVVIAKGVARRQARARGHSEAVELRVLS